jgi:hypothetical protein
MQAMNKQHSNTARNTETNSPPRTNTEANAAQAPRFEVNRLPAPSFIVARRPSYDKSRLQSSHSAGPSITSPPPVHQSALQIGKLSQM